MKIWLLRCKYYIYGEINECIIRGYSDYDKALAALNECNTEDDPDSIYYLSETELE